MQVPITLFVIPADPGSEPALDLIQGPGQAPESSIFKELQKSRIPLFNGATAFYGTIKIACR
jgi:hypothetical protein